MNAQVIGQKLKQLRNCKSIKEVAQAIGVGESTISMYESGARIPKDEIKLRIARYYGTSVESIFFTD